VGTTHQREEKPQVFTASRTLRPRKTDSVFFLQPVIRKLPFSKGTVLWVALLK